MLLNKDEYLELENSFIQIRSCQKILKEINTQLYHKIELLYGISIAEITMEGYSNNNSLEYISNRLMILNLLQNTDDEKEFNFELFEQYIMMFKTSKGDTSVSQNDKLSITKK